MDIGLTTIEGKPVMRTAIRLLSLILTMLISAVALSAQPIDDKIDALFEDLKSARTVIEAKPIELEIWEAWRIHPAQDAMDRLERAQNLWAVGSALEAVAQLDEAIVAYPDWASLWNLRATYHFVLGNFELSLSDVDAVLEREPRHFGALSGAGGIFLAQGDYRRALDHYERAIKVYPAMPQVKVRVKQLQRVLGPAI